MPEPLRLSKRVAQLKGCSRREAEQYIEGGWVTVDGAVVELPEARVHEGQQVFISPDARPMALLPVTLLLHKPVGAEAGLGGLPDGSRAADWLKPEQWLGPQQADMRPLRRHLLNQELLTPLAPRASGLVVFTQDLRIARKLREDARTMEHEVLVDVAGAIAPGGLERLNRPDAAWTMDGQPLGPCKVSWQSETRLRFALKGERPGQIAHLCACVGLDIRAMRRLRIGRVALGSLAPGQWRFLLPHERF